MLPSSQRLYEVYFEVQIRTIFEYAWSKTTHALAYKSPVVDWKRQRLAAQLKAATEQMETLILAFDLASEHITASYSPEIEDQAKIYKQFKDLFDRGSLPTELEPSDWTRFSINIYKIFQLASNQKPTGRSYKPINDIDKLLSKITSYINDTGSNSVPRSISLFQLVFCILFSGEKMDLKNRDDYYLLVTNEMRDLFPHLYLPCKSFDLGSDY
ncbi:hypothetical protein [Acaryochloris sp. CCMEE 5410]|uniref:hypothetical protein n=1 Tax=Acaryochloris sp. CCMEE 5410 TaxID=310037 RepID=UPI0021D06DA4|nr:hypothetical protein [Acaryochloris sp. CCMEE 5410]KAI9130984.1 hypothetical protein ON05_025160 [Acaryochloris sp. CCMEE 5410]